MTALPVVPHPLTEKQCVLVCPITYIYSLVLCKVYLKNGLYGWIRKNEVDLIRPVCH